MAQLGAGFGTSYPAEIDTRQTYQNGPTPAPDSDTRIDSELVNDSLEALVTVQQTLGANPQGSFGSVAARLNFYLPESSGITNVIPFIEQTLVYVPGANHGLGTAALLWDVYDASPTRAVIQPGSFTVDPINFDVTMTFAVPQTGTLVLDAPAAHYAHGFSDTTSITIAGGLHGLGTADLLIRLYDDSTPRQAISPQSITVNTTTFEVVIVFPGTALRSGTVVLSPGRLAYVQPFTNATTVTIPGTSHDLTTAALLWQIYDASPTPAVIQASAMTVHPGSFTATVTFAVPQSGRVVLAAAVEPMGALLLREARALPRTSAFPLVPATVLELTQAVYLLTARLLALESSYSAMAASLLVPATTSEETPVSVTSP